MLEAVQDLTLGDYETDFAEQFGELQVAIVKARSILYRPNANFVELMSAMDDLAEKTTGLKGMTEVTSAEDVPDETITPAETQLAPSALEQAVQVDWTGLGEVVAEISRLNPNDFTASSYARVLSQLEVAKSLLGNSDATQATVEDLVLKSTSPCSLSNMHLRLKISPLLTLHRQLALNPLPILHLQLQPSIKIQL